MRHLFTSLLFVASILTGCAGFLDRAPVSEMVADNFFRTGADAESSLSAAYDMLQSEYYIFDMFINGDVVADDCYAGGDNPNNFQLDQFAIATTNINVERDWRYLYEGISRANAVLANVGDIDAPDLTASRQSEILGEAAWLRAFHYFQLVNLWGEVPLITELVTSTAPEIVHKPKASTEDIYRQIISDLEFALTHVAQTNDDRGKITIGAVHGLLAKAHAFKPQPDWGLVDAHAAQVVESGDYQLLSSFDHLWDGNHENSVESIFEIQYQGGTNEANWGPQLLLPPSKTGDNWRKFNTPSNDLIEAYLAAGDQVRLNASILFEENLPWQDANFPDGNIPFPYKLRNANGWSSPNNVILLRLADIILLQAEAKNQLGQLEASKILLNEVRVRVNLPANTDSQPEELQTAIELERRLELAFEGHRWFDLKRSGRAIETMNALGLGYQVNSDKLVFPIPQNEMDRNPELLQNKGY
ncbi:RagB/SusD family nutrient uptake outer membrane protein [Pontibacter sp. G13]|uniref:RagB/SusD family nutrient uptake outer membrane protein n=1 Tax=Pontibacter sp. G13 TaxID=3074898 RepID=UPI002889369E|nr:RagB/SusD family nutrient uptake outer membrane protein [Pontibacter sp. G13]WNJ20879.1 RagB/SusD family nutrient uptake outer membrane protein [Pontibacter sp. G13]